MSLKNPLVGKFAGLTSPPRYFLPSRAACPLKAVDMTRQHSRAGFELQSAVDICSRVLSLSVPGAFALSPGVRRGLCVCLPVFWCVHALGLGSGVGCV